MEDALFILLILTGSAALAFRMIFVRRKGFTLVKDTPDMVKLHDTLSKKVRDMPQKRLTMHSRDGLTLRARYFPAVKPTNRTVLLSHGYRGEGLHDHAHNVLYYFSRGYNVLLPDHRSHGDSDGRYISFGALESVDILDWCRLLTKEYGAEKIMLHGISMGAAAVIVASETKLPQLMGTVADCSYTSGHEIFAHVTRHVLHIPGVFMLKPVIRASKLITKADIMTDTPIEAIKNATVPFLFIHGAADDFVPTEMGRRLFDACSTRKKLLLFEKAGHADSVRTAPMRYYSEIDSFMYEIGM